MRAKRSNTIGENVLQRRTALDLSQRALAEKAGTTAAAVSHIERGQRQPSADLLGRLAAALECTTDALVSTQDSPSPESIYLARVTSAMKSFPAKVQEEVADYCDFLKQRKKE
jgi:transcriptional regulator with XRE-family HTH domain